MIYQNYILYISKLIIIFLNYKLIHIKYFKFDLAIKTNEKYSIFSIAIINVATYNSRSMHLVIIYNILYII